MKQKDRITQYSLIIWAVFLTAFFSASVQAATHYVSATGSASWANCTSISTPCSLKTANANATAGDTVYLRGGTYTGASGDTGNSMIRPRNNGTSGNPIVFIKYAGETPTLDAQDVPDRTWVNLINNFNEFITIDGLTFINCAEKWGILSGGDNAKLADGIIIQNNHLTRSGISTKSATNILIKDNTIVDPVWGGINFSGSRYNTSTQTRTEGNTITGITAKSDGITFHEDSSGYQLGNYHISKNNTISASPPAENCFDITSGRYIVSDGDVCNGTIQKGSWGIANVSWVRVVNCTTTGSMPLGSHIYFSGSTTSYAFVSRSQFRGTGRSNLRWAWDGGSGTKTTFRIFHNVFDGRGLEYSGSSPDINMLIDEKVTDIASKNNIFFLKYANAQLNYALGWASLGAADFLSDYNLYWHEDDSPGADLFRNGPSTLAEIRTNYSRERKGVEGNPRFFDKTNANYSLTSGSAAIDAGGWLTTITTATGSGTTFTVDDPLWFYDGWNITGEIGDTIKTQNARTATITSINYSTGAIKVDRSISWTKGEGIGLDYKGTRPDIGAKEYSSGKPSSIPPPGTLHITN